MGYTLADAPAPVSDQRASAKVFISYSRKDTDFANWLEATLKAHGFEVFIDRHEISVLEEWWKRIETLIAQADTIVFVLSPDSLASKYTQKEISFATSLNKRFAPIVHRCIDGQLVPEALAKLNYIFFDDEAKFEISADKLAQALRGDITWIRLHTEFGRAARQWSVANRPNGLLLRSPLLEEAERWIAARPEGVPLPTEETRTFIEDSRAATSRRRNILTASLIFGIVLATGLSGYAFYQRSQVQQQLDRANSALAAAITNDFTFVAILPFTARHRQALWKLAVADESVKSSFISALSKNPAEVVRLAPGFIQISRALGLLWPSATEAGILFDSAVKGLQGSPLVNMSAAELNALAEKLSEDQTAHALEGILLQLGQTNDFKFLRGLPQAIQALAPKLTGTQARQALDPLLRQIGLTSDALALQALVQAFQALPAKPSGADVQQALDSLLRNIGATKAPFELRALAQALQSLAPVLTEMQARQAIDPVLRQIGATVDLQTMQALGQALQALPVEPSEAEAQQTLDPLLRHIAETRSPLELRALAQGLQWLAPELTETQVRQALDPVLWQVGETSDTSALRALAQTLRALVAKWSGVQASQSLYSVLAQIAQGTDPRELRTAAQQLQALAPKLTDTQAQQALDPVLRQIGETPDTSALQALTQAIQALTPKLTEEQVEQVFNLILQQVVKTFDFEALRAAAEALQVLVLKSTDSQAQRAFDPVLQKVANTVDSNALGALAKVVQALAPKLTDSQVLQASRLASSSLAWAASENEAGEWARLLAVLSYRLRSQETSEGLVAAIAYPASAGPATEFLLEAIRAQNPDAPTEETGTNAGLKWLATKYPWVLDAPVCLQPPQFPTIPDFKCPPLETKQRIRWLANGPDRVFQQIERTTLGRGQDVR